MKLILPKLEAVTRNAELVEADNIRRSIKRITAKNYGSTSAKRAILQAMLMTGEFSFEEISGVRTALKIA